MDSSSKVLSLRYMRSFYRCSLSLVLLVSVALGQPLEDQFVAKYGENDSPYPLYMGEQGPDPVYSQADLELIARNFNACYGNPNWSSQQMATIRSINPDFELAPYVGNWRVRNVNYLDLDDQNREFSDEEVERLFKGEFLYYRYANLASAISVSETSIQVTDTNGTVFASTAPAGAVSGSFSGNTFFHITWVVIGGEFMRIEGVSGNTLTVTRGWDGTIPKAHSAGAAIAVPVYGTDPEPGGTSRFDYRTNPTTSIRWIDILNRLLREHDNRGRGGVWIDILDGNLSSNRMDGGGVSTGRRWDIVDDTALTVQEFSLGANDGVHFMQTEFLARRGVYPIIWGNNVLHPTNENSDRLELLRSNEQKPRPVDGFAQENHVGGYGSGGESGKVFSWTGYESWIERTQSTMFMGEKKYSARPLILDGGVDNRQFSAEPESFRHQVLLFGYASYLMAVKVEDDDSIFTQIGFTPLVGPDGSKSVELPEFFQWQIGRPSETRASSDVLGYRLPDSLVFQRRFEHGIVLVNPHETEQTISLDQPYLDLLSNGAMINEITMPAKTARLLFSEPESELDVLGIELRQDEELISVQCSTYPGNEYRWETNSDLRSEWDESEGSFVAKGIVSTREFAIEEGMPFLRLAKLP